jgi:hypothetical protein
MELFNLSLLAKQAWRVFQSPESLSAQLLWAVYFPANDFLGGRFGFPAISNLVVPDRGT